MFKKFLGVILVTLLLATSGYALEIAGVNMPDTISADNNNLVLNGAGLRTKFFIKAYIGGLYLQQKSNNAQAIMNADQPMAVRLVIISKLITSDKMESAVREGFENATNGNIAPIKDKIETFINVFKDPLKINDTFEFVYVPGKGLEIFKNGAAKKTIPGVDFKKAMFGIWLSDKPAQESLKAEMLGKK